MPNLKVTINLTKLDKTAFFDGKNGKYVSLVLWENRDGEDQYGNTHACKQDLGKDRKGEKSDYVGNAKPLGQAGDKRGGQQSMPPPKGQGGWDDEESDSIPF